MDGYSSPSLLWQGFDPAAAVTDVSVIRDEVTEGVRTYAFYFTALKSGDAVVRAYVCARYRIADIQRKGTKLPAVLVLSAGGVPPVLPKGVAEITLDILGAREGKDRFTLYPPAFDYANPALGLSGDALFTVTGSPKETPWYVWTAMTRRAATLILALPFVDTARLGLYGAGLSCVVGWNVLGTDNRFRCAVLVDPAGHEGESIFRIGAAADASESATLFRSCFGVTGHLPQTQCPVLFHMGTNTPTGMFDRISQAVGRATDTPIFFSVTPRGERALGTEQKQNLLLWWEGQLKGAADFPALPTLVVRREDGKRIASLSAAPGPVLPSALKLFYAVAGAAPACRNWTDLGAGDGPSLSAAVPLFVTGQYAFVLGVATYPDGLTIAAPEVAFLTDADDTVLPMPRSRMLYDARTVGTGCTYPLPGEDPTQSAPQTESRLGLSGVAVQGAGLSTYIFGDPRVAPPNGEAELCFSCYTETDQPLTIAMTEYIDGIPGQNYTKILALSGLRVWQRVVVAYADFKNDGRALPGWQNVKKMTLSARNVLVSTLLWV
ncbi:MAG: hypothetical protein LBM78_01255 [Clostridiales bacterium]|jgi:hypothetical protein|nr:hypothetical protein [Clostridiales bacterium]